MLTIRLQRIGKAKKPTYRLIVSEKAHDTQGVYLEHLGTFDPRAQEGGFLPVAERVKYWISKGAQTSNTVNNLLLKAGIIQGKKKKSVYLSEKRKKKIAEKSAQGGSASGGKPVAATAPVAEVKPAAVPAPDPAVAAQPAAAPAPVV